MKPNSAEWLKYRRDEYEAQRVEMEAEDAASVPPAPPTPDDRYKALLDEKLRWFAEAEASDVKQHPDASDEVLTYALRELRHFAPSACHWAINVAIDRLAALRAEVAAARLAIDDTLAALREPLTATDARRGRDILTHYDNDWRKRAARSSAAGEDTR